MKQSLYDVPLLTYISCALVWMIMAMFLSTSYSVFLAETRLRRTFLASSIRSWRTSHHGDSGARSTPTMMGMGQNHWIAYGMRQPHSSSRCRSPRKTPPEMVCPITH